MRIHDILGWLALTTSATCLVSSCKSEFSGCEVTLECPKVQGPGGAGGTNGDGGEAGGAGTAGSNACGSPCEAPKPFCDESSGACVACLESTDCTDAAAPRCDDGACVGCADTADCEHIPGKHACDEPSQACVECTVDDESACDGNSCDPATNRCTSTPLGQTGTCKPCLADSECEDGHRCIELDYLDEPHGWYCMPLPPMEAGCASGSPAPWKVGLLDRESRSGAEETNYCGLNEGLTTCEAVLAALEGQGVGCTDHDACPAGGVCEFVGAAGTGDNRCTYRCGDVNQCPSAEESPDLASCPVAANRYCGRLL